MNSIPFEKTLTLGPRRSESKNPLMDPRRGASSPEPSVASKKTLKQKEPEKVPELNSRPLVPPKVKKKPQKQPHVSFEHAVETLSAYWPALFGHGLKLMKIDLLEDLYEDINRQELPLSKKGLRRCIRAIARSRDYLEKAIQGAPRYDKQGQPCGQVTEEQCQFAQKRLKK